MSEFDDSDGENRLTQTLADLRPLPIELAESAEFEVRLAAALEKLSADERALLLLRLKEDLPFHEIADVFKEPLNTVKSRYRRGLARLRHLLAGT